MMQNPTCLPSKIRFLIVVLGTYKQMRNQSVAIMSDIDEDNFDRAFDILRPGMLLQTAEHTTCSLTGGC